MTLQAQQVQIFHQSDYGMSDMAISTLTVSLSYKNRAWLKDFQPSKGKMQSVNLAFLENNIERIFLQVHGVQTGICSWFIVIFVDPYQLHSEDVHISYSLLMILAG